MNEKILNKLAKTVRIVTIPPILVTLLVLCMHFTLIIGSKQSFMAILFLAIIPALAYPISYIIPKFNKIGRREQRWLAFVISFFSYLCGFLYSKIKHCQKHVDIIYTTYFISVIVLFIINIFHFKISGHACGVGGALVFALFYFGLLSIIPTMLISLGVVWSSLQLNRHTLPQLIGGFIVAIIVFFIGLAFY